MHKSDMKSNPNDRGKGTGGQSKDENRNHQGQDAKHDQATKQGQPAKQGHQKAQPDGRQQDQQRKERSNMAGDQDVENPNAQRAGARGVTHRPAGKNKPEKGMDDEDQYNQNGVDDEDVDDTAESSKQKKNEKRHSM